MLKITKKIEILPQKVESSYAVHHETEERLMNVVRAASGLGLEQIEEYLARMPSISAALLAEIIQKVVAELQESNVDESLALILQVATLHQYFFLNSVMNANFGITSNTNTE